MCIFVVCNLEMEKVPIWVVQCSNRLGTLKRNWADTTDTVNDIQLNQFWKWLV